jgi:hypothetical protein
MVLGEGVRYSLKTLLVRPHDSNGQTDLIRAGWRLWNFQHKKMISPNPL